MIEIVKPGLQTTVQDGGRRGYQAYGVPVCGAMDWQALALANILAGNPWDEAALEICALGPTVTFLQDAVFALAGADEDTLAAGRVYGENLGLAFQIVDDLLDLEGDAALMGKTLGKDVQEGKITWPACVGVEQAKQDAAACIEKAKAALNIPKLHPTFLQELAEYTLHRVQ